MSVFRNIYSYNRPTFTWRCRMFVGSVHDRVADFRSLLYVMRQRLRL